MIAIAGLDVHRFLHTRDPFEQRVTMAVVKRAFEIRELFDRNRAVLTANAVGKLFRAS